MKQKTEYRWRKVVFGIEEEIVDWRTAMAVSPIVWGKSKKVGHTSLAALAKYTGMDRRTLRKIMNKLIGVKMINPVGKDKYSVNYALGLRKFIRYTKGGDDAHPIYFRMGVRGRECPLNPSENYLYWWVRSQIAQGHRTLYGKRTHRLTWMPRRTIKRARNGLFRKGWLAKDEEGLLVLPEVDLARYFPRSRSRSGGRRSDFCLNDFDVLAEPKPAKPRTPRKPKPKEVEAPESLGDKLLAGILAKRQAAAETPPADEQQPRVAAVRIEEIDLDQPFWGFRKRIEEINQPDDDFVDDAFLEELRRM